MWLGHERLCDPCVTTRYEAGKLVSVLTGIFGIDRLQLAEEVVQEALVRALQTRPYYGVPQNPAARLTSTAKNLALDLIRREKLFRDKQPQIIAFIEPWRDNPEASDSPLLEGQTLCLLFNDLQAGIGACHCAAKDYESTDWRQILFLYDRLAEL